MDAAQTIAALEARIERLEELTRQQSLAMMSVWGITSVSKMEDASGSDRKLFEELEDSIKKMVGMFGGSDGRHD